MADLSAAPSGWVRYRGEFARMDLRGRLELPAGAPGAALASLRWPVVIIAHGSAGVDGRGAAWGEFLRRHGIATFEIDYFGPRNVVATSREQPSPTSDVYDAMALLATHPRLDAQRIAVLGLSRGGFLALRAADGASKLVDGARIVAAVGLYPPCPQLLEVDPDPALPPLLIQVGSADEIALASACERIATEGAARGRSVRTTVYDGAAHAWDGSFSGYWYHPAAGRGYTFRADAALTERSRAEVLSFLRAPLGLDR